MGLDVRGYNYGKLRSGDALVVVSTDGTVRHRKSLVDLFHADEIARFGRTGGGIDWNGGGWIDERREQIIVVGVGGGAPFPRLFRIVDMKSGDVRNGSPDVVLTALSESNIGALKIAISLAAEWKLERAKPDLVKLFSDENIPIDSRLRAAVALATMGDRRGGELMRKVAVEASGNSDYAISNLGVVLGDIAAPVLCEIVRRFGKDKSDSAWQAMHAQISGKAAVPPLLELLREGKPEYVDFAVECLIDKGPDAKAAVPALINLLDFEPKTKLPWLTHRLAATALGRIGPDAEAALPSLIRLAREHAPAEWEKVKASQPELRDRDFGEKTYSDDEYIDAICKIRRK